MSKLKYAKDQMAAALVACRQHGVGVRKAAEQFHVPRSTLSDKLMGKSPEQCKCGPNTILSTKVLAYLRLQLAPVLTR